MRKLNPQFGVIIDAGHGGISPKTRQYTTAPAKMHRHATPSYHSNELFYEGVANRVLADKIIDLLRRLHIPYYKVYHDYEDWSLRERVRLANEYYEANPWSVGISLHHNASPSHTATGLEAFTSPGQTRSDHFADLIYIQWYDLMAQYFPIRSNKTDGDHDKEARFAMVVQTRAPFVLTENGFFDNPKDALLLMHPRVQMIQAICHVNAILQFIDHHKYYLQ